MTRAEALLGRDLPTADEVIEALVANPAMPKVTLRFDLGASTVPAPLMTLEPLADTAAPDGSQ